MSRRIIFSPWSSSLDEFFFPFYSEVDFSSGRKRLRAGDLEDAKDSEKNNVVSRKSDATEILDDGEKFKVNIDCKTFLPGDLKVEITKDGYLEIEGNHKEEIDGKSFITNTFCRKYLLPENTQKEQAKTSLSGNGMLTIVVPKKPEENIEIPIIMEKIDNDFKK